MLLPRRETRPDESSVELVLSSTPVIYRHCGRMTGNPVASDAESQQLLWIRYGSLKNTGSC